MKINKHTLLLRYLLHLFLVIYTHYFFFYSIPAKNKKLFNQLSAGHILYLLIFIYLVVSSYQIREGYSDDPLKNPYKRISILENKLEKIFKAMPFLFELKNVLDWTITRTSLDLF